VLSPVTIFVALHLLQTTNDNFRLNSFVNFGNKSYDKQRHTFHVTCTIYAPRVKALPACLKFISLVILSTTRIPGARGSVVG
jgi:hypothetical protein